MASSALLLEKIATPHSLDVPISSVQMSKVVSPPKENESTKVSLQINPEDTVTIGDKVQKVKQRSVMKNNIIENNNRQSHILFVYTVKGDLRIRFMDSVNKLVYQIPSEFMAKMTDLMILPQTSVTTKG